MVKNRASLIKMYHQFKIIQILKNLKQKKSEKESIDYEIAGGPRS